MSYDVIDTYIERERRCLKMPGVSLAIVEGDQIVHLSGFGRARPGGEAPAPNTPFFIGSVTKSFTALAIMQLVEAGKIDLDAPVQRYLPWFRVADPVASTRITVRHLLNQTGGLPQWTGEVIADDAAQDPASAERHARALSTLVLTRPPGSAHEYSNANYLLLGLILETVTGESWADYVQLHILDPLRMTRTTTSSALAKQRGLAVGHRYWFGFPFPVRTKPLPQSGLAGGGLISTAQDLAHYVIAHLNGGCFDGAPILSEAGIEALHRGATQLGPEAVPADLTVLRPLMKGVPMPQYAMGWYVDTIGTTRVVSHGGTLPDFAAEVVLLPEQKKGMVLLFNGCHHWMNPALSDVTMRAAALLAGEQHASFPGFRAIPHLLRSLLLIPALQLVDVVATLRRLRRWRIDPRSRPDRHRVWGTHIVLPVILNLLFALNLIPMFDKRRGYRLLYKPDSSWMVLVCGVFAVVWSLVRTVLILASPGKPSVTTLHGTTRLGGE